MKKLISILAVSMLLACSFTSCGDSDDGSESTSKKSKTSASSTDDEDETDEDDTEEDETESTKKNKKSKEKATDEDETEATTKKSRKQKATEEDETEDETEATTKKSKKKEKTTSSISDDDLPGEIGGDIIGKWAIDEDTIETFIGEKDFRGFSITDCYMEFDDDGICTINMNVDMSSVMCIKDEEPNSLYIEKDKDYMKGTTFCMGGICAPIYDFDGKSFKAGVNGKYTTFTRDKKSDDIYGKYDIPKDFGSGDTKNGSLEFVESGLEFVESGVAYMNFSYTKDFIYDDDEGTLTSDDSDKEPARVRFIDDDTMIIASGDGEIGTLTRAD